MRIVHYISLMRHDVGGPSRAVLDMCSALASAGHEVALVTGDGEAWPREWKTDPAFNWDGAERVGGVITPRMWKVNSPNWPIKRFSPGELRRLKNMLVGTDVVHLHGLWEPSNSQIATLARSMNIPYVVSIHGVLDDWSMAQRGWKKRLYLGIMGRRTLEQAAFVHCTAEGEQEQSRKWMPAARVKVIPCLFDLGPYHNLPGPDAARAKFPHLTNGRPSVLFLSRVHYKKGIEVLIDAAALLRDAGVEANILIAGGGDEGYLAGLRRQVASLNLADRVEFLGAVKSPHKESLYQACQVFALPSSQENFGFVFFEALACELPVVTTFNVDTWQELKESGGSVIVKRDARAFADAIKGVLSQPAARAQMGSKGRAWVMENLDTGKVLRSFERAYEEAVGNA